MAATLGSVIALTVGGTPDALAAAIRFDDLAHGTTVGSQYEGATGATFVTSVPWFNPDDPSTGSSDEWTGVLPVAQLDALADSAPNVGEIGGCAHEFCAPRAQAFVKFSVPQQSVSLHIGDYGAPAEFADVSLSSYDREGNVVDSSGAPSSVSGGTGYGTALSNSSALGRISFVRVRANGPGRNHVAIDSLNFASPPGPPPPSTVSFDIQRTGPNPFAFGLAPGESRSAPLTVLRYGMSQGPIVFDFPGLPDFFTAEVEPNPADVPDGGTVMIQIAATEGVAPIVNAPVTVRARAVDPAKTGAGERSLTIPVTVRGRQTVALSGIEVTQGVQEDLNNPPGIASTPSKDAGLPKPAELGKPATYAGVKLVEHRKTVVRVFGSSGLGGASIAGAQVVLRGFGTGGKELPGSSGLAAVQVTRDGAVLATRARSAHAPHVHILAPRKGARTGRRRTTLVALHATDADNDPVYLKVDYSADGGHRWRNVYVGPNRRRLPLASTFFSASQHARVRVVANDGFNEGTAVSRPFVARGWAPGVVITSPARGHRQPNDAALFLSGEGSDDRFQALRGRALRWYVGSRRIGSGNTAAVVGLSAGRKRIRLVACAGRGRCSAVSTAVRLTQAKPRLTQLAVPARLARRARHIRFRVASTVPAMLRIRGRRFRLSRASRAIALRVRPGRKPVDVRFCLSAGRRRSTGRFIVTRS